MECLLKLCLFDQINKKKFEENHKNELKKQTYQFQKLEQLVLKYREGLNQSQKVLF